MTFLNIAVIILSVLLAVLLLNLSYKAGYKKAKKEYKYRKQQRRIRKSGRYIVSRSGRLIPIPPMPPSRTTDTESN
jgi:preprotein translocase subunit SecG